MRLRAVCRNLPTTFIESSMSLVNWVIMLPLAGSCIRAAILLLITNEESNMQMNKMSGAALAAAAAMLFSSAITTTAFAGDEASVHCAGVNSCKGTSECKGAKNSCKGMNSCKGQGWVSMTKSACADAKAKAKS